MAADNEDGAPGWEAIDAACVRLHGTREPLHVAPKLPFQVGGEDPLDGISAYPVDDPAHWHLVTYGMSELYRKESENLEESGWGFEFTVRLERGDGETRPPSWVFDFLQHVARYVYQSGNWFAPGHQMDLNGPIAVGEDTQIRAILFVEDPGLGTIDTPHGKVQFLQILGIRPEERAAAVRWNTEGMAELLARTDPHGIIALGRSSILDDPAIQAEVDRGMQRDGSSCGFVFGGLREVSFDHGIEVVMGANQVDDLSALILGRLPFGEDLMVSGEGNLLLLLTPGNAVTCGPGGQPGQSVLELTEDTAREVAQTLRPQRGSYTFESAPSLRITIVPSEIKDKDGKVIRTVG